jgi:hypothetical protein
MILLARKVFPELVCFKPKAFAYFLIFMALLTGLRFFHFWVTGVNPMSLELFNFLRLFLVFWEDMFFVFPSLLLYHLTRNKHLTAPIMIISSIIFSMGHVYQGVDWALILLGYVPMAMYFARRHGLGTVMVCHVTYDVLTYLCYYLISLGIT